jgi:hypothetical protein
MFSLLRIVLIVGVIFYHSPVRNPADGWGVRERPTDSLKDEAPARLEAVWGALPERARQSIVDRIVMSAVGSANPATAALKHTPPTDTLEPQDLQPAWRGETKRTP